MDGVGVIVLIAMAAFGIDRIVVGLLFAFSFVPLWTKYFPDPATMEKSIPQKVAKKKQKLMYYVFGALLGGAVLAWFGNIRIFHALGVPDANPIVDCVMTGLVLVAGADRLAGILKLPGAAQPEAAPARPIEITGRLTLDSDTESSGPTKNTKKGS